jgi:hypothetical protein
MSLETLQWQFAEIAKTDPQRAVMLEAAPSSDALEDMVAVAFSTALTSGNVHLGMEEVESNSNDLQGVLQFHVGAKMFDWFFNARTGYRAQHRASWQAGLAYNSAVIEALREHVRALPHPAVTAKRLNASFKDCGAFEVTVSQLVNSLEPCLSKLCVATVFIGSDAPLPLVGTGPRILLEEGNSWSTIYRDDPDAWLEVKGAFLGVSGPYQIKDPVKRAQDLQRTGSM